MAGYVHGSVAVKRHIHSYEIESHRESKWPRDEVPAFVTLRKFRDGEVTCFTPEEARSFAAALVIAANDAEKKS